MKYKREKAKNNARNFALLLLEKEAVARRSVVLKKWERAKDSFNSPHKPRWSINFAVGTPIWMLVYV